MALTNAERQRRYRAHKAGDHSQCAETADCDRGTAVVTTGVTRNTVTAPPLGLRGRRLWDASTDGVELRPRELVLLEEACRLADRLDRLDLFLRGESDRWLDLAPSEDGPVIVVIDKALSEARQQQTALKQLLAELRQSASETVAPRRGQGGQTRVSGTGARSTNGRGAGRVADLTARIAERRAAPAG